MVITTRATPKTTAVDRSALLRELDPRQRRLLELFRKQGSATSTEMAAYLKMSPRTLVQLSREWTGSGFLEYQNAARKNRSYRLAGRSSGFFPEHDLAIG